MDRLARLARAVLTLAVGALVLAQVIASETASAAGGFVPLKSRLQQGRYDPIPVNLPDGRILIAGGVTDWSKGPPWSSKLVDSFDPSSQTFTASSPLAYPRSGVRPTVLADGRVLFVGGEQWFASGSAEVLDPATGESKLITTGDPFERDLSSAPLPDGKALIFGGAVMWYDPDDEQVKYTPKKTARILDPDTGSMEQIADMPVSMSSATTFVLPDGRLLIFGQMDASPRTVDRAMIFDPATKSFSMDGQVDVPRSGAALAALDDGKVLIVGGSDGKQYVPSTEIFDPETGRSIPTGQETIARSGAEAARLTDGRILIVGGYAPERHNGKRVVWRTRKSEVYDPVSGSLTRAGDLASRRAGMAVAPMPGGRALVAGGALPDYDYLYGDGSAEVFDPELELPRVEGLDVTPRYRSIKVGRPFSFKLKIENSGDGAAPPIRVCADRVRWEVFERLECPTVEDLQPGESRTVRLKGSFGTPEGLAANRRSRIGKKRRMVISAVGQGVEARVAVTVRVIR